MCLLKCQCDSLLAVSVAVCLCVGVSNWPEGRQHFTINLGATKASYYSWPEATTKRRLGLENWQCSGDRTAGNKEDLSMLR